MPVACSRVLHWGRHGSQDAADRGCCCLWGPQSLTCGQLHLSAVLLLCLPAHANTGTLLARQLCGHPLCGECCAGQQPALHAYLSSRAVWALVVVGSWSLRQLCLSLEQPLSFTNPADPPPSCCSLASMALSVLPVRVISQRNKAYMTQLQHTVQVG